MTIRTYAPIRTMMAALLMALALGLHPPRALAQAPPAAEWQYGTTLAAFLGAASASSDTVGAAGLSAGWEVTPRFGVEGRGVWIGAGDNEDAFAAALTARLALQPARPFVPFVAGGAGLYRATVSAANAPAFYRRRLQAGIGAEETFTDFAFVLGGGADLYLTRRLALRPEMTAWVATHRSHARVVAVYGVQLAWHFEDHPITPMR